MTEVELRKEKCLPEVCAKDLKVIFCGTAAGRLAAQMGHHYANPQNRFWPVLLEAGFVAKNITPSADRKQRENNFDALLKRGLGLTDLIVDQCGNDDELTIDRMQVKKARFRLMLLIIRWQPQYLAFNGKKAAQLYLGKEKVEYGLQPPTNDIGDTKIFILPSTSPAASRWWPSFKHHWRDLAKITK